MCAKTSKILINVPEEIAAEEAMTAGRVFSADQTHGVLQRFQASINTSSEGLGWSSVFASTQRERPFAGKFDAISDCLMVLHRSGPVGVTFRGDGRVVSREIPRGAIFFLPAGHECEVSLHAPLDTIHIYLRADLFANRENGSAAPAELSPYLGERDIVLEHLANAVAEAMNDNVPCSSLLVDPIAQAIASRFLAVNGRISTGRDAQRPNKLSAKQLQRTRDFVEANLDSDIRLKALADVCGLSTEYFVRLFKNAVGISPYQYVIGLRVERAKALLSEESQSLCQVALQCGFSHQEHMTRVFRRFTGQTPGRYRRSSS
jgi:AraC family transcriptional regulator